MANGNIYIFNIFGEAMTLLSLNGLSVGALAAWSQGPEPPLYTPASLAVSRVLNASESPGHFYNGKNRVILGWESGVYHCDVAIDGTRFPISENLVLEIMQNEWILVTTYGAVVESGPVTPGPAWTVARGLGGNNIGGNNIGGNNRVGKGRSNHGGS